MEFFSLLKDIAPEDDSETRDYAVVPDAEALSAWLAKRPESAPVAVTFDLTNSFVGLAYKAGEGRAVALSLLESLKDLLASNAVPKIVHDAKAFLIAASDPPIHPQNIAEDVMLYAFLLHADPGGCSPEALAERFLDRKLNAAAEQQAEALWAVAATLRPELEAQELRGVYETIDLPLAPVLAQMEQTGIRVDTDVLAELSTRLTQRVEGIAQNIYDLAGHPFNVNSPQQLGKVLFEELNLPAPVKWGKGK
jgi:DNA polymerase-1